MSGSIVHHVRGHGARRRRPHLALAVGVVAAVAGVTASLDGGATTAHAATTPEVRCDFDHDGRSDLATGAPGEDTVGAVIVSYNHPPGGGSALLLSDVQQLTPPGADGEHAKGFGFSLACGDFDDDGTDDLAVGAPLADGTGASAGEIRVGRFFIFHGEPEVGLDPNPTWYTQNNGGFAGIASQDKFEQFGMSMVAGDFDGDGDDDLAVSAPRDDDGRGMVAIAHGPIGVVLDVDVITPTPVADPDELDFGQFGRSLAAGEMDVVPGDDLVVGAPGTRFDGNHGRVYVFSGASALVKDLHSTSFGQISATDFEQFGQSVAVGDFNGDGFAGVAIGAPSFSSKFGTAERDGMVFVAPGTATGPQPLDGAAFNQLGVGWVPEDGDAFGYAVAAVDLDGDGADDLAVGAPLEDVQGVVDAGAVVVRMSRHAAGELVWDSSDTYTQYPNPSGYNVLDRHDGGDRFGASLARGWFAGDQTEDLLIGSPGDREEWFPWPSKHHGAGKVYIGIGWPSNGGSTLFDQHIAPGVAMEPSDIATGEPGELIVFGEATGWSLGS